MFTSAIATVELDTVVVVPDTVKSPVTVKSFPIVTSFGSPIVTVAVSEPEPATSTSFAVPVIVETYAPVVSVPSATESAAFVNAILTFPRLVIVPLPVTSPVRLM